VNRRVPFFVCVLLNGVTTHKKRQLYDTIMILVARGHHLLYFISH
jgi:hypothetical protein